MNANHFMDTLTHLTIWHVVESWMEGHFVDTVTHLTIWHWS